jgi:hypothetical protein
MRDAAADGSGDAEDACTWLLRMRQGDFEAAWQASDRIRRRRAGHRNWTIPRHLQQVWDGTPFDRRRVLIRCYHGLGDTIQFIRYASLVRATAREVIAWVQPALVPLLRAASGIDTVLPLHDGAPDADYDVDIEVMELPYAFRTTVATIPGEVPYLTATPVVIQGGRPRIGVVWRAGEWDEARSLNFRDLCPLFDEPGTWISLQYGRRRYESHARLQVMGVSEIERLASVIAALDLIISIDSMPAHLGGALGTPVWTLLPQHADWRWMEHRRDTPWYPTMRLFRQSHGGWPSVINEIRELLRGKDAYFSSTLPIE